MGLAFAELLYLGKVKIQGWTFYLTGPEVIFEVLVRLVFAALAGIALATILTAVTATFLWRFTLLRERLVQWITGIGVVVVLFMDSRFALTTLMKCSNRGVRFITALLIAHFLA